MVSREWKRFLTIHYLLFTIHLLRLSRPERVEDAEGGARGVGEVSEGDGRGAALPQRGADGARLLALPLVLRAQARARLAAVGVEGRAPKVLDDERAPGAVDFDALLLERAVALGEIGDGAVRAVGELERDEDRVVHAL